MTRSRPVRALRCALLACAATVATAGCTAASSSQTVTGKTLDIYVSAPASAGSVTEQQDILYAEKLAFNQLQSSVTSFKLRLVPVVAAKPSDNARTAISDTSAIAYLGEVPPGASADSIGITNAQDVLQVSPSDTAAELTQSVPGIKSSPTKYYESLSTYGRTFARVVPTTAVEAQFDIQQLGRLGVKRLDVTSDGSEYGRALAQEVTADASPGIVVTQSASGSDAVFYAGSSTSGATSVLDQAAAGNPRIKLFVPSALAEQSFVAQLAPAAQRQLYISSPGVPASSQSAKKFVSDFRSTYGHTPSTQAIFGYAAMASVIQVIAQAGSGAGNRSTVVHKFFALRNQPSVVGTFAIDANGDTSLRTIVLSRVKAGRLIPATAVTARR